jgi:hypothetical protein
MSKRFAALMALAIAIAPVAAQAATVVSTPGAQVLVRINHHWVPYSPGQVLNAGTRVLVRNGTAKIVYAGGYKATVVFKGIVMTEAKAAALAATGGAGAAGVGAAGAGGLSAGTIAGVVAGGAVVAGGVASGVTGNQKPKTP